MFPNIRTERYNIGKILSAGSKVYFEKFGAIAPVILIVYIPINIILSFIPLGSDGFERLSLYFRLVQILELLFGIIATVAVAKIVECSINGEPITYAEALKFSLTRWGWAIAVQLLAGLIILGMFLLLIVPGVIWAIYYTFVVYVVALRGIGGKTALDYSKRLVKGQWGRVFWIGLLINLLCILAAFIIGFVIEMPFDLLPENKIIDIISSTVVDLVIGLFSVIWVVFFLNVDYLRTANKGDTQVCK